MSEWVLSRLGIEDNHRFSEITKKLLRGKQPGLVLAELNDWLDGLTAGRFEAATILPPPAGLSAYLNNYVAAMVELTAHRLGLPAPDWTGDIAPLAEPAFAAELKSLRLHLLLSSPPPFRRRNIYIDSSVGARV